MNRMTRAGWRLDTVVAAYTFREPPSATSLSRWVAPLPTWLENVALRLAWWIVAINLLGTLGGLWYYVPQLGWTPLVLWPFVPMSPFATLFMAGSLAAWRLGIDADWLHMLAFLGNIKLGLWTPIVQLGLQWGIGIPLPIYAFLVVSHLGMVAQAFLIYRYASFSVPSIVLVTAWYTLNDVVDYLVPLYGTYTHTWLIAELVDGEIDHSVPAHDYAAAVAITLTVLVVMLAFLTRLELERSMNEERRGMARPSERR